jgi:anaerobic ribonucleoside-triphosphate reductase activating protein
MNIAAIKNFDVGNGDGVRVSVFVSGCSIHCKGCHNQEAWDYNFGQKFDNELKDKIFKMCEDENITGLSILGGEPFDTNNREEVLKFIEEFKSKFKKDVWIWTGFTLEQLKQGKNPIDLKIVSLVDAIIDGPYIEEKRDITLKYRGSTNQRVFIRDGNKLKQLK